MIAALSELCPRGAEPSNEITLIVTLDELDVKCVAKFDGARRVARRLFAQAHAQEAAEALVAGDEVLPLARIFVIFDAEVGDEKAECIFVNHGTRGIYTRRRRGPTVPVSLYTATK